MVYGDRETGSKHHVNRRRRRSHHQRKGTVVERLALAVICGTLWWWKLRGEIEALVGVVEIKSVKLDGGLLSIIRPSK